MSTLLAPGLSAIAGLAIAYTLLAALIAGKWRAGSPPPADRRPAVSILKPLHGDEPGLENALRGFLDQDYAAPIQMVCGVADDADPALAIARAIPGCDIVVDPRQHGANRKISNLINMAPHARNDLIVISDSDISVDRTYLARIAVELRDPAVGAVTCLYAGHGLAGFWSRLAAGGISYQFLPGVMVGLVTGMARPCMGSTIALSRATLDRIGGFGRFADILADDHAIGAAVRDLGLRVAIPPMIVTHGCDESSFAALFRHELRWAVTVRGVQPIGHAGSVLAHPFVLALAAFISGGSGFLPVAALAARAIVALRIDALAGRRSMPLWVLPFRDVLSFAVLVASFFVRSVEWRTTRLTVGRDGTIGGDTEM